MLGYLAAISGIDPQLYEAAICDGATRFQQTIHITIPSISYIISIMLVFAVGGILSAGFEQILRNAGFYRRGKWVEVRNLIWTFPHPIVSKCKKTLEDKLRRVSWKYHVPDVEVQDHEEEL